jgi:methyl-accepting chemotaxis protein
VAEVNSMTEREVLGAARNVSAIVDHATTTIERLKKLAARFDGGGGDGGIASSIGEQTQMVHQFVVELVELARAQADVSLSAQKIMVDLGRATRAIDKLASEAKILALNSRIEAGRASASNRASSVVSDEMRRLSGAVAVTNTGISDLSVSVGSALTQVVKHSTHMRQRIERFAEESAVSATNLLAKVDSFRGETAGALAATDQQIADVVRCSHAALSNLQFQDVVAQGLLRLDGRMRDLQLQVATACGVPEPNLIVAPPAHKEVGGEKVVVHKSAGDLLLF